MKPKFHIGQQVVFITNGGSLMGTIVSASSSDTGWRYHVRTEEGSAAVSFVSESEVQYYLEDHTWYDPTKIRIDPAILQRRSQLNK